MTAGSWPRPATSTPRWSRPSTTLRSRCSWSRPAPSGSATPATGPRRWPPGSTSPPTTSTSTPTWPATRRPRPASGPTRGPTTVAVVNADDPVVAAHRGRARRRTFGFSGAETAHRPRRAARGRRPPAHGGGRPPSRAAPRPGQRPRRRAHGRCRRRGRRGRHRGADRLRRPAPPGAAGRRAGGVRWYDDSKATTPHATRAAVEAFTSVVLIAGGRNKGIDLHDLLGDRETRCGPSWPSAKPPTRSWPPSPGASAVERADSMADAVGAADALALARRRRRAVARLCFLRLVLVLRRAGRRLRPSRPHPSRPRGGPAMSPTTSPETGRAAPPTRRERAAGGPRTTPAPPGSGTLGPARAQAAAGRPVLDLRRPARGGDGAGPARPGDGDVRGVGQRPPDLGIGLGQLHPPGRLRLGRRRRDVRR